MALAVLLLALGLSRGSAAQPDPGTVLIHVRSRSAPVAGAAVAAGGSTVLTDDRGSARLELAAGAQTLTVARDGFAPASAVVNVAPGGTVTSEVELRPLQFESEVTVVAATRTGTMLEDQPLHVEGVPQEEVEENLTIAPGNLTTLFEELPGLQVVTVAPSLGGVGLRLRGLRGRYTRVLVDELPLFGDEADSLGLLQAPPLDLSQVEVIKGANGALYSGALAGVVNLVSQRPGGEPKALVALSSQRGADVSAFLPHQVDERWGLTLLAAGSGREKQDLDGDGWAELPGYRRGVVRPRLFWDDGSGDSLFVTAGTMAEARDGGTLRGRMTPDGTAFQDHLETRRLDGGVVGRFALGDRLLAIHASLDGTDRDRRRGAIVEHDRLRTGYGEISLTGSHGRNTWVLGAASHHDAAIVEGGADLVTTGFGVFAQDEIAVSPRVRVATGARLDRSPGYGVSLDPLVSMLWKPRPTLQVRLSSGAAHALPTLVGEEAEEVGLARVAPPARLRLERAASTALDVGWAGGPWEVDGALFVSRVHAPLLAREAEGSLVVSNDSRAERVRGSELLARYSRGALHVIANHTWLDATAGDPDGSGRVRAPRVPDQTTELAAILEREERGRIGVELAYTGHQRLEVDPYRRVSPGFVELNLLGELRFGETGAFVSATNLTGSRQSRFDPLLLPAPTTVDRWTTDVWGPLAGRSVEVGVRLEM